ncbi:MAG: hypothetical protein PHT60_06055 [Acidiphilium sp.]|nr:hypothetical protein [Acidiphilium sp.]MDD4935327.1 hypothetical protein [Acidiphilium sp.]
MPTALTPTGFTAATVAPQTDAVGQVVGINLQNTSSTALAVQPISFGETFLAGAVQATDQLTATIGGQTYAVQMDVKTTNPDGSVAMAVMTIDAPPLAANSTTGVMLSVGGTPNAGISGTTADLTSALRNYSLSATIDVTANAGGTIGVQTINIADAVTAALQAGTATMWLNGSLAQEAIVSIPVSGSLRIEADVTAYANGTISADLQFNNDVAMQAAGGTLTYSTTITQNGITVASQPSLTQYQYQDWSTKVGTVPTSGGVNVQENIPYLEAMGAVQNYDTQYGVASSSIASEAAAVAAPGWNAPLGTDGITQYMPETGGRGDIGPTTTANATWLITQNATAAQYALGQAQEAGSVPWHFYDPTSGGSFLTPGTPGEVNVWTDPRGNPGLTQQVSGQSGWTTDQAHMPDLSYDAYLQTGNVQFLEQLNAQASFAEANQWNPTRQVTTPKGVTYTDIVVNQQQVRGAAWSLRAIQEAANANPTGSADYMYFTRATNDNYVYLVSMIPTWTQQEGQAYGYLMGAYGGPGAMPPWQQDYLASTIIQGAEMGNKNALTFLKWETNFLVGRFFAANQGFSPKDGIAYNLQYYNAADSNSQGPNSPTAIYTSWAQIEQATEAAGGSNIAGSGVGSGWGQSNGDYGALALQTLAGIITVGSANPTVMDSTQYQAMQAFGWLLASGAPYVLPSSTATTTAQFLIDPRLANGQLLSFGNVIISVDTTPTLLTPIDPTQNTLLYAGAGTDTLVGGTGINLLFGGSGTDTIIGGPNGNDIFAGSGDETIIAGGGANFIQASSTDSLTAGTGSDLFVINQQASGAVTISGFNPSLDRLDLVDGSGAPLSISMIASIIGGIQSVVGGLVLHVSTTELLTVEVTSSASISGAWFQEQAQALTTTPGTGGTSTGSSGGSVGAPPTTTVAGGASVTGEATISGGSQQTNVIAGAGTSTVQVGSVGFDSISGGAGPTTVFGGGAAFEFQANSGAVLIDQRNTSSNAEIISGSGDMTINSGAGFDYIDIANTNNNSSVVISGYSFARNPINYTGFLNNDHLRSASFNASGGTITLVDGQTVQLNYADPAANVSSGTATVAAQSGAGSLPQIVTLNQAGQNFVGGATPVILSDQSGGNTITGGSGGISMTDQAGHDLISTAANVSNTLDLVGADTVMSTGRDAITMSGGGVVSAGGGQLTFVGGTQASTIFGGAGAVNATSGSGGIHITGGAGAITLVEGTGADLVSAGAGNMTLSGGSGTLTFVTGVGNALINQVSGNAKITSGAGNVTINEGTGFDYFNFNSVAGSGSITINDFKAERTNFSYANVNIQSYSFGKTSDQLMLTDGTKITMNIGSPTI